MKKIVTVFNRITYIMNKPQKILCVIVFILTCIGSLLECIGVSAIIPVVNVIMDPTSVTTSSLFAKMFGESIISYDALVAIIISGVIVIYLLKNGFFVFLSWARIKFSCKIQREISIKMLESYMSRGYHFFLNKTIGELNRGVNEDIYAVYQVLYAGFRLLSDFMTIVFICIFMFFSDFMLSVIMCVVAGLCILLIYFVFRKQMLKAGKDYYTYSGRAGQSVLEAFQGVKDILVLRRQRFFIDEYEENQIQLQKALSKQTVGGESPAYIIEGVCVTGLMLAVAVRVIAGDNSVDFVATLAAFAIGAFRILPSLGRISNVLNVVMGSIQGVNSVYENIVEAEKYEKEHPEARFHRSQTNELIGRVKKKNIVGLKNDLLDLKVGFNTLQLRSITFGYEKSVDTILENVNITIHKGQSVAFIGASGAGKSTLIDILLGLLMPQKGGIYLDGKAIVDMPDDWARVVGYVPQTVFLTSGSIKRNVAFGEPEELIDEERIREALERAELLQFVESLPSGMETCVGDRGVRLSGGQRQRIAIARALYHRPEIMVLDEATSALDTETEAAIMSAIESLQGSVTLIIVAHRLTTIRKCDVIYEVKDKKIIERDKAEVLKGVSTFENM